LDSEWDTDHNFADRDTMATSVITAITTADTTIGIAEDEQKIDKM
jgi:hypothetical protein